MTRTGIEHRCYLGLDGYESTLFCFCEFQTSCWCRRCHASIRWKVSHLDEFHFRENIRSSVFVRMIDNSRVGVTFARKRTVGGRRGGSFNNGGDRYSRGGDSDSRYRRRYSPRQDDRYNWSLFEQISFSLLLLFVSTRIDVDDILVLVVQFNRINVIIVKGLDHDRHHPSNNFIHAKYQITCLIF